MLSVVGWFQCQVFEKFFANGDQDVLHTTSDTLLLSVSLISYFILLSMGK